MMLALAGDVMLGRGVDAVLPHGPPTAPWGDLLPLLHEADLRVINLECALTTHQQPWQRTPKVFHFRADPSAVEVLQAAAIDGVSLANNHAMDFEEQGLLDTEAILDGAGIHHAGAGRNQDEARRPAILTPKGDGHHRVGLVAFTDNEPVWAAEADHPGTNYLPVACTAAVLDRVSAAVTEARRLGATTVVVSNHWGPNMVQRPSALFRAFARSVIDRGADIYYGHSAHVVQGLEIYRGKPILYDTGDFLDDYARDPVLRNDWSFLFRLLLTDDGKVTQLQLIPVSLDYAVVRQAVGLERDAMLQRMEALCREMGTPLQRHGGWLLWNQRQ